MMRGCRRLSVQTNDVNVLTCKGCLTNHARKARRCWSGALARHFRALRIVFSVTLSTVLTVATIISGKITVTCAVQMLEKTPGRKTHKPACAKPRIICDPAAPPAHNHHPSTVFLARLLTSYPRPNVMEDPIPLTLKHRANKVFFAILLTLSSMPDALRPPCHPLTKAIGAMCSS